MTEFEVETYNQNNPLLRITFRAIVQENKDAGRIREQINSGALHCFYSTGNIPEYGINNFLARCIPIAAFYHFLLRNIATVTEWDIDDIIIYRVEEIRRPDNMQLFKVSENDRTILTQNPI